VPASREARGGARDGGGHARAAAALALLACAALLPSLFSPFVADDYFHVAEAAHPREALTHGWVLPIDSGGAWWTPHGLSVEYFRPLVVVSFAIDRLLYGESAAGYHLTNLVLHATATLLAWAIARRVLGAGFSAWVSAALFAIHPCHVQAVSWISGRTDVLAALFYMAALALYLESRERPHARTRRVRLALLSVLAFLLALTAKEMAITFPVVVFAHGLLRPDGEARARRLMVPALATAVAGLYIGLRATVLGGLHPPPTPFAFHFGDPGLLWHLVTAPLLYLGDFTMFVPTDPVITVPFWRAHTAFFLLFAAVVLFTFARTLRQAADRRTAVWCLGWIGVTLLPVAMLPLGEHFLYLPSLGYCILVGSQMPSSAAAQPFASWPWAAIDARGRRGLATVGGLVLLVCIGRTLLFGSVARASARTVAQAAGALDRAPDARLLLVADLPTGASLAFGLAISQARHGQKADVGILSLLPALTADAAARSVISLTPPDALVLSRGEGFIHSYVERALAGPRTSFGKGETFERAGYTVTVVDAPEGQLRAFEARLSDPAHTLVLGESEQGLVSLGVGLGASSAPPPAPPRVPPP
jgi:hypothetical protein